MSFVGDAARFIGNIPEEYDRGYPVFYRERPGVIQIIRVIHGRGNIPDILDEL